MQILWDSVAHCVAFNDLRWRVFVFQSNYGIPLFSRLTAPGGALKVTVCLHRWPVCSKKRHPLLNQTDEIGFQLRQNVVKGQESINS